MFRVNANYLNLNESYLFSTIAHKVASYKEQNPGCREVISLGIGDVTQPLVPAVVDAMEKASRQMGRQETFRGYGPEQGYSFLREAIALNDYNDRGVDIAPDEIFIGDGAKSDIANILDILGSDNTVALADPVYPVYLDSNIMAGRKEIFKLPATASNNYAPQIPRNGIDIIYLCYPNNPTGATLTRKELQEWIEYARRNRSLILFDSAYEAFITDEDVPHSIYELPGAKEVAIEFRSFSKTAGFTGIRCGYTVVPKTLTGLAECVSGNRREVSLRELWNRRQTTKFNGASYISQRAAEAVYSPAGKLQTREIIEYYRQNAKLLRESLQSLGCNVTGGINAPYIWLSTPDGVESWDFFDQLLKKCQLVVTPGVGFGEYGEGHVRLTAFNTREKTIEAIERLQTSL